MKFPKIYRYEVYWASGDQSIIESHWNIKSMWKLIRKGKVTLEDNKVVNYSQIETLKLMGDNGE